MCNLLTGEVVPIPILFAEESTTKVGVSQIKSPVPPVSAVRVPREVMFDCAALVTVAAEPLTFPVTSPVMLAIKLAVV